MRRLSHTAIRMHNAATVTATSATVNCVNPNDGAYTRAAIQIQGQANTASVVLDGTIDGENWHDVEIARIDNTDDYSTTMSSDNIYIANITGLLKLRTRYTADNSTVTVWLVLVAA